MTQTSTVDSDSDGGGSEIVCAAMYVCNTARDVDDILEKEWDLEACGSQRLHDWLALFWGTELVGDDEN